LEEVEELEELEQELEEEDSAEMTQAEFIAQLIAQMESNE